MIAVIEGDDSRFAGRVTRNLHRILNGFRAAIEEDGLFREVARREVDDTLGQGHVWLIHHDAEAGMHILRGLFSDGLHHLRAAVADIHDANAPGKVDIAVAINIFYNGPLGLRSEYG